MDNLNGRVAVVTGGASGIGRAMARRFAAESMRVVVADVEEPPLHETVADITDLGGDAIAVVCDVSSWSSVEALQQQTLHAFGPTDVLCNNAGVAAAGAIAEVSLKTWEWCLGVNLWGVIHGCKAFLPTMIERGTGHIVNTASVLGHVSSPGVGPYNVSKHGVVALSETLHAELSAAQAGVGVTCLCPGVVSTNILDSERNRPERFFDRAASGVLDDDPDSEAESRLRDAVREVYRQAMAPSVAADMVLEAVVADRFWLFTDGDFDEALAERHRSIETRGTPAGSGRIIDALLGSQGTVADNPASGAETAAEHV